MTKFISDYQIFGLIPLDLTLHFIVGLLLTVFFMKAFGLKHAKTLLLIAFIGLIKECYDSYTINATITEAVEDFIATIAYPLFAWGIGFIKNKLED